MAAFVTINGCRIETPAGRSVFDVATTAGVRVPTSCVTQGKCKECVVEITGGDALLAPPTPFERHLKAPFRLSCQATVVADAGEIRCHTMRRGQMRVERHATDLPTGGRAHSIDPAVTREGDRILIDGREVDRSSGPIHGLAMDLGTTTIVLRLIDLDTGGLVADAAFENPQRFGGSDVMSRIRYDTEHSGKLLRRTLAGYIAHALEEFPVDPETIYEAVVVGNSTMRDLFFRQNVHSIGQSPYRSVTELEMIAGRRATTSLTDSGRRCLLPIHPNARVYGLPIVSGHIGADAAACLLAVDIAHEDRLVALMDIGTNTELIVGNRHRILAASCPAGPAFEGGAIACGMPGLDGAIDDVRIHDGGRFELTVIGGGPPEGICGSGLVSLLSELVRTGRMNELGRFADGGSRLTLDANHDVHFLESDVNELAQAKAANVAGLQVVFSEYGIQFDDVAVFYLAGGFGRHIKTEAARRIGLIPNLADSKIVQIGNAAIEGATIALLSASRRRELESIVKRIEHCRLETHPGFFDFFVDGCQFRPLGSREPVAG
jgi:uncharacterized 2Fe-2S/4Fe-4S cluster protein (DUF4445 family)